jgi:hypothetical protein
MIDYIKSEDVDGFVRKLSTISKTESKKMLEELFNEPSNRFFISKLFAAHPDIMLSLNQPKETPKYTPKPKKKDYEEEIILDDKED